MHSKSVQEKKKRKHKCLLYATYSVMHVIMIHYPARLFKDKCYPWKSLNELCVFKTVFTSDWEQWLPGKHSIAWAALCAARRRMAVQKKTAGPRVLWHATHLLIWMTCHNQSYNLLSQDTDYHCCFIASLFLIIHCFAHVADSSMHLCVWVCVCVSDPGLNLEPAYQRYPTKSKRHYLHSPLLCDYSWFSCD